MFRLEKLGIVLPLVVILMLSYTEKVSAQNRLCITFSKGSEYINIIEAEESSVTRIEIIREGFESEANRQKAWDEYYEGPPTEERVPIFYVSFFATEKQEVLSEIKREQVCKEQASADEVRKNDFEWPKDVRSDLFILIQTLETGKSVYWEAALDPIE